MNHRGQTSLTKTGILLVVIIFYSTLFVLIGYINSYFDTNTDVSTNSIGFGSTACDCGTLTCSEYAMIYGQSAMQSLCSSQSSDKISFTSSIISGIKDIPFWLNTILFGTLITVIAWILLSSLPTFNGGG